MSFIKDYCFISLSTNVNFCLSVIDRNGHDVKTHENKILKLKIDLEDQERQNINMASVKGLGNFKVI